MNKYLVVFLACILSSESVSAQTVVVKYAVIADYEVDDLVSKMAIEILKNQLISSPNFIEATYSDSVYTVLSTISKKDELNGGVAISWVIYVKKPYGRLLANHGVIIAGNNKSEWLANDLYSKLFDQYSHYKTIRSLDDLIDNQE